MAIHANEGQSSQRHAAVDGDSSERHHPVPSFQFADNRPVTIAQRNLQRSADNSSSIGQLAACRVVANSRGNPSAGLLQRKLSFSGEPKNVASGKNLLTEAYAVGAPELAGNLVFADAGLDPYKNPNYLAAEATRPKKDGLGAHLIGKIIDDGQVHVYFGEHSNNARPNDVDAVEQGKPSSGTVLLRDDATAIQLIHELIHTYHFAFDPWDDKAQGKDVPIAVDGGTEDVIAEEASTVGLGPWKDSELTENAFRKQMPGLKQRDRYGEWEDK